MQAYICEDLETDSSGFVRLWPLVSLLNQLRNQYLAARLLSWTLRSFGEPGYPRTGAVMSAYEMMTQLSQGFKLASSTTESLSSTPSINHDVCEAALVLTSNEAPVLQYSHQDGM